MAITHQAANVIHLAGTVVRVNDLTTSEILTPGMAVARSGGAYGFHPAAAAGPLTLALDAPEENKGIGDAYADGDLLWAGVFPSGSTGLAWLASGQNVSDGDVLESAGSGKLRALASGEPLARAIEAINATTGDARVRVEAI
jgi:hypothetical protein